MALYTIQDGTAVKWAGEAINDVLHPLSIEYKWSDEELAAIGLYKPLPADDIPEGFVRTGSTVEVVDGLPKEVNVLEAYVPPAVTTEDVNEYRTYRIEQGHLFSVTGIPGVMRVTGRPDDMDTLLGLVVTAQLRISEGDTTLTHYRDGDNRDFQLSPAQIVELWKLAMAWVEKVYQVSWAIKAMDPIPQHYAVLFEDMLVA